MTAPQPGDTQVPPSPTPPAPTPAPASREPARDKPHESPRVHEVSFVTYPKLLFVWPLVLAGYVFWPFAAPPRPGPVAQPPAAEVSTPGTLAQPAPGASDEPTKPAVSARLEYLGWVYIWVAALVFLTLGVDVDRNQAAFWVILVVALWVLGLWLHDVKHFTFFGDIYRWFASLDVQYNRNLGFALSVVLSVPYLIMLLWARVNDRWRITHNEFEHYSFGRMNDSLGRGAKTIRTVFPDVFELLLGLAGTLIVYNATGTKELRRIPHVMFLPSVRKRLNTILERTAITGMPGTDEDEEEEEEEHP